MGQFGRVVEALGSLEGALPGRLQLLVVCGTDERTRQRLQERSRATPMPMRVFGFVEQMAELMAASELLVAKAGGLTVSEALSRGIPLVLYHVIPGQEQMNARYASQHGAAVIAHRPSDVAQTVRRLIEHPDQLVAMRKAARALGHPEAAEAIVSRVITPLVSTR